MDSKSSSSLARQPPYKVGMVCHCYLNSNSDDDSTIDIYHQYNIYIVDLDLDLDGGGHERTLIKPTIQFEGRYPHVGFCVVDSILYAFAGGNFDDVGVVFAGKLAITPEILDGYNHKLERDNLIAIKDPHQLKHRPTPVPTPDGKSILVYQHIVPRAYHEDDYLELYDIAGDSWELLPLLPIRRVGLGSLISFGFETASRFVIQTGQDAFVLDLQEDVKEWKRWCYFPFPRKTGYVLEIDGGRFFIQNGGAHDITNNGLSDLFHFPFEAFSEYSDPILRSFPPRITFLGYNNGAIDSCVLQACAYTEKLDKLGIHILRTEIDRYKKDRKALGREASLHTTTVKAFRFLIGADTTYASPKFLPMVGESRQDVI